MRAAAITLTVLACAGCSAKPTQQVVDQCEAAADVAFAKRPVGQLIEPNLHIEACMRAKGFSLDWSTTGCRSSHDPYSDVACYRRAR